MTNEKKGFLQGAKLLTVICLAFAAILLSKGTTAYAAPSAIRVSEVEYTKEQVLIENNENTQIYFATEAEAAKNKWEVVEADTDTVTEIDISWLSATADNILVFKGNIVSTQHRVTIKKKPTKLEVTINYDKMTSLADSAQVATLVNIMSTVGDGNDPIDFADLQWRKGDNGSWEDSSSLTVKLLKQYLVMGTYVYFRIAAIDDSATSPASADGTEGRRYSTEIKVKIVKQSSPVVYGVDGSKFLVDIKYGKEYRVTYNGGTTTQWVKVTDRSLYKLPIATIIGSATGDDGSVETKEFEKMKIEIRDYATNKTPASKISTIDLTATKQRVITKAIVKGLPATVATTDDNIYVDYNGDTNINLLIPQASTTTPYEYCVVKKGGTYDVTKVTWSSVTKGTTIKIPVSKAVDGGTLYVRMKEIKSKAATSTSSAVTYQLASTYQSFALNYPSVPYIAPTKLEFTKGYGTDLPITIVLNAEGKKPFETELVSVKLGTKTIEFVNPPVTVEHPTTKVQTMTVILKADSLAALPNCYSKALTFTFKNKTVNKTSVKLTVQSPTPAGDLVFATTAGTSGTKIVISTAKASGNKWAYTITTDKIDNVNTVDTIDKFTSFTPVPITSATWDNIPVSAGQYLTVYELTDGLSKDYIVRYSSVKIGTY